MTRFHPGARALLGLGLGAGAALAPFDRALALLTLAAVGLTAWGGRPVARALPWIVPAALVNVLLLRLALGPSGWEAGLHGSARASTAVLAGVWFAATTPPRDLLALLRPLPRASLALAAAARLAPALARDVRAVREARLARGDRKPRPASLLAPAFVRTVRRGRSVDAALRAAGFGGPRVSYARATWRAVDWGLVALAALPVALALWP